MCCSKIHVCFCIENGRCLSWVYNNETSRCDGWIIERQAETAEVETNDDLDNYDSEGSTTAEVKEEEEEEDIDDGGSSSERYYTTFDDFPIGVTEEDSGHDESFSYGHIHFPYGGTSGREEDNCERVSASLTAEDHCSSFYRIPCSKDDDISYGGESPMVERGSEGDSTKSTAEDYYDDFYGR